jgi:hypothetical protein
MSGLRDGYWPDMSAPAAAGLGVKRAAHTAYFVAGATCVLALLAWFDIFYLASPPSIVDALLFAVLGFFIARRSRVAAVLGLALYWLEVIDRLLPGKPGNAGGYFVVVAIFTLFFVNGIRGSFALSRLERRNTSLEAGAPAEVNRFDVQ